MRFSEIEPFIRDGSYEIDVFLDTLELTLDGFRKTYNLELNPDFQRSVVWTEQQQIDYLEFFFRGGRTARTIYFNSPAFGTGERGDLDETILCVDGLQRITSFLRFINNEIPIFGTYYRDFKDSPRITQKLTFNINALKYRSEVLEWYLKFNSGGTVHTQEELERVRILLEESLIAQQSKS
ncbi:hypothetical protein ABD91_21240 [Lysinibacillus sphaericus]|uniref:DUF262 domain-containing protein n=1 Tax=Lysinibacillus sphaericus TaxID=1421 RepID=UPI0018CD34D2|nr:DUF262 domain-containing protein [Lysinibacillus sphaericus]MBG9693264.1 hypothetical protein [Lysinibacillus sphaericus]